MATKIKKKEDRSLFDSDGESGASDRSISPPQLNARINLDSAHFERVLSSAENLSEIQKQHGYSTLSREASLEGESSTEFGFSPRGSMRHSHTIDLDSARFTEPSAIERQLSNGLSNHQLSSSSLVDFDLTEDTLKGLFNKMDVNKDGMATLEEFRNCLRARGVMGSNEKFKKLFRITDSDNDGHVSFAQFVQAVQCVQMHACYDRTRRKRGGTIMGEVRAGTIHVLNYSRTRVERLSPSDFNIRHRQFFFSETPKWSNVQWVHMRGMDKHMLRRFAVKFRLHPLALEDAMVPVVDAMSLEQRPKAEKFREHLFFIVPRVKIVRTVRKKHEDGAATSVQRGAAYVCSWLPCCCMFRCLRRMCGHCGDMLRPPYARRRARYASRGRADTDSTPYTVLLDDEVTSTTDVRNKGYAAKNDQHRSSHYRHHHRKRGRLQKGQIETIRLSQLCVFVMSNRTLFTVQVGQDEDEFVGSGGDSRKWDWHIFERRLASRTSRLRHNGAYFLLYSIMDAVVHEYEPVVEAFQKRLELYEHHLLHSNPDLHISKSVTRLKRQCEMFHRLVRPVREVVRHCIEDLNTLASANTLTYLRDVLDHIDQVLDDCKSAIEGCRNANEQIVQIRDQKMNEVMYFLTLITAVFVPGEFITGVYGMNFDIMPELKWTFSYEVFWIFFVAQGAATLLYFRSRGWI